MMSYVHEIKISHYSSALAKTNVPVTIHDALLSILNGHEEATITRCRRHLSEGETELYKSAKSTLSASTFSGLFDGPHKVSTLLHHSKLITLDLDHLEKYNLAKLKDTLIKDEFILATWLSPSGMGLKVLVKTGATADTHKIYFAQLCKYFASKFSLEVDKSGSDLSRLCYTSFDPELKSKTNSEIFEVDLKEFAVQPSPSIPFQKSLNDQYKITDPKVEKYLFFATEGKNRPSDRNSIRRIIKYLKAKDLSITDTYENWYRVALAISNTFTFDVGRSYYLRLCELDGVNHDEYKSLNMLDYCYRNKRLGEVNFASIIYLAMQRGYKPL